MKTCEHKGCTNFQFGGGFCKYHQYERRKQGGDKFKRKPNKTPKESPKRKEEHKRYIQNCAELTQEIKDANNNKIYCFFSGLEITGTPIYHHLQGRTGKFYLDKDNLVPCLNEYHNQFHFTSVDSLKQDWWYADFLVRLKAKSTELYNKEMRKQEKTLKPLNYKLFDDEYEDLL